MLRACVLEKGLVVSVRARDRLLFFVQHGDVVVRDCVCRLISNRTEEQLNRLLDMPVRLFDERHVHKEVRVARLDGHRGPQLGTRFGKAARVHQDDGKIAACLDVPGLDGNRTPELIDRFGGESSSVIEQAEVVSRFGVEFVSRQHHDIVFQRLVEVAERLIPDSQLEFGIPGLGTRIP